MLPVSDLVARPLCAKSQASMLALLRTEARPPATNALSAEVKAHVSVLAGHLAKERPREAIATALAMIFLDPDHAISCMRRDGVLRASQYGYRGSLIGRIAKAVLNVRDVLSASPDRIAYLESVEALSRVAGNAAALKLDIEAKIRAHRTVVLKTIFVVVNSLFYHGWINDPEASSPGWEAILVRGVRRGRVARIAYLRVDVPSRRPFLRPRRHRGIREERAHLRPTVGKRNSA